MVRIPAGATNIDIKQVSYSGKPEDDNYLGEGTDLSASIKPRKLSFTVYVEGTEGVWSICRRKRASVCESKWSVSPSER